MTEYTVRLIYPSGTIKDVLHTTSKDEAEDYIKTSKELRPRLRHQLGTKHNRPMDYAFICRASDMGMWAT